MFREQLPQARQRARFLARVLGGYAARCLFSRRAWQLRDVALQLPAALAESCDTFFYDLGLRFYHLPEDRGSPLQFWARRMGFGEPTGVDIGPESNGLLPTPEWRRQHYRTAIDRLWKPGNSVTLAIGQDDLLVTPLQMTRFYALLANEGKLVQPHLVAQVEQTRMGDPGRVLLHAGGGLPVVVS